jgi:hypothetical protein
VSGRRRAQLADRRLFDEVNALMTRLFQEGRSLGVLESVRARWLDLWREHCEDGRSHRLSTADLGWLASLGWQLEMIEENYRGAAAILRVYLEHPDVDQDHPINGMSLKSQYAQSLLGAGDEAEALAILRSVIEVEERKDQRVAALMAFCPLFYYCSDQPPKERASTELTDLVERVVRRLLRSEAVWVRSPEVTYAELYDLMEGFRCPPPGPLATELESLWDLHEKEPDSPNLRARWPALWREYLEGDHLWTARPGDAASAFSLGWDIMMNDGRFEEAAALATLALEHPKFRQMGPQFHVEWRCALAAARLSEGDEAGALPAFHSAIDTPEPKAARAALRAAREYVEVFCRRRPGSERASPELTHLAAEVVRRLRRRKTLPVQPGERARYSELCGLLESAAR